MPPSVTKTAKTLRPTILISKLILDIEEMAKAPKYIIEVKLTNTYTNNQNTAITVLTVSLYLLDKNCGMVKILFFK